MNSIIDIVDSNWKDEVLDSDIPVLVDFWAEWCGPCKALAPTIDQLDNELSGQVKIVKVNVENNEDIVRQFGIKSIPTLVVMCNGEVKGVVRNIRKDTLKDNILNIIQDNT